MSNLYQYDATAGLQSRFDEGSPLNPNMINFAALQEDKANLGWYPGKYLSNNILWKYIGNTFKQDGTKDETTISAKTGFGLKEKGISQEDFANHYKEHLGSVGPFATFKQALSPEDFATYLITGKLPVSNNNSNSNQSNNSSAWGGSGHVYQGSSFNVSGKGHSLRQK